MKENKRQKLVELIGEATMCWEPIPAGVFKSDKAIEIADEIIALFGPAPLSQTERECCEKCKASGFYACASPLCPCHTQRSDSR